MNRQCNVTCPVGIRLRGGTQISVVQFGADEEMEDAEEAHEEQPFRYVHYRVSFETLRNTDALQDSSS